MTKVQKSLSTSKTASKIFEVLHPVQEYAKMWIPDKRYQTNMLRTF